MPLKPDMRVILTAADGTAISITSNALHVHVASGTVAATLSEPISVDDNGSSLTVDVGTALPAGTNNIGDVDVASIAAGDNLVGRVKVSDGTTVATVRELGTNDALNVSVVDGSGNQVTSFGGAGVQYTEGDTDASITGNAILWEDTGNTLRPVAAGTPLPVGDAGGSLTIDGSVTADTELPAAAALADGASATPTTPTVGTVPHLMNATTIDRARAVVNGLNSTGTGIAAAGMVGQLDDSGTSSVTENQFAVMRISSRRALLIEGVASGTNVNVNLAASAATVTADTELPAAAALADGASATPTTPTVGTVPHLMNATTIDRARAVVNGLNSTGTGIAAAGIVGQLDDTSTGSVTENQFAPLRISSRRALLIEGVASGTAVTVDSELPAAASLADNTATPTAPAVGAFNMVYDGSNWDMLRGTSADGVLCNTELPAAGAAADGASNPTAPFVIAAMADWNETTWDRRRNNVDRIFLSSAARTVSTGTGAFGTYNLRGIALTVTITAGAGYNIQPSLQFFDPATGNYFTYWTGTALTGAGTTTYYFADGAVGTGGSFTQTLGFGLPGRNMNFIMIHNNANSVTYTVGATLLV